MKICPLDQSRRLQTRVSPAMSTALVKNRPGPEAVRTRRQGNSWGQRGMRKLFTQRSNLGAHPQPLRAGKTTLIFVSEIPAENKNRINAIFPISQVSVIYRHRGLDV